MRVLSASRRWILVLVVFALAAAAVGIGAASVAAADPPARLLCFVRPAALESTMADSLGKPAAAELRRQLEEAAAPYKDRPVMGLFARFGPELVSIGDGGGLPLRVLDLVKPALASGNADAVRRLLATWTRRYCLMGYHVARNYAGPLDAAMMLGVTEAGEYVVETYWTPWPEFARDRGPDAFKGITFSYSLGVKAPAGAGQASLDDTTWLVDDQPVAWIFRKGGVIEAPGLWKGDWRKRESDYAVVITTEGMTDSFTVRLSSDGMSFTTYRDGAIDRTGLRKR